MNIKSFIAGAIFGAIVFAVATRLMVDDDLTQPVPPNTAQTVRPPTSDAPSTARNPLRPPTFATQNIQTAARPEPVPTPAIEPIEADRSVDQPSTSSQIKLPEIVTPAPITELHKKLLAENKDKDRHSNKPTDAHAELEAEAKDDSWAYYMEQSLQQFLAGHPDSPNFVISNIECRTTMCEIQAIGYDESTGPAWNAMLFDMRQQPWFDFSESGSSSSSIDGSMAIITTLRR